MRYMVDVAFSILFGVMSLVAAFAIVFSGTAFVVSLVDLVIDTGIQVTLGSVLQALVVSICLFAVSTRLFMYFSREKYS